MKAPGFRRRIPAGIMLTAVLATAGLLQLMDANPAASQAQTLAARPASSDPGLDPNAKAWADTPAVDITLSAQLANYPTGGGSIATVSAKALHRGETLYIRVEWADTTRDDSTLRVENFSDAVALEFPSSGSATVPSICMGQAGNGVNIWQWRADSQTGHGDPAERYPNLLVEMYPSHDPEFYTARAVGNPYALADGGPVQNLVAQSFGSLTPAASQTVQGEGVYANGKWAVVFARPFKGESTDLTAFHETGTTDMAFAVWNGSESDRSGQKSVSAFVRLHVLGGGGGGSRVPVLSLALGLLAAVTALGIGLAYFGARKGAS